MASQPAGEEDEIHRLVSRDDGQTRVDYGDVDKGPEFDCVPRELDAVVDGAVDLIRRVKRGHSDDEVDLDVILDNIDIALNIRRRGDTVAVPYEFIEQIDQFITEVYNYFEARTNNANDFYDGVSTIMTPYRAKVVALIRGCLIAKLKFEDEDDLQFSHFVSGLHTLAGKLRDMIVNKEEMKSLLEVVLARRNDIPTEISVDLPNFMEEITRRIRLEISMEKDEMLNFLEQETNEIKLTILTQIYPPDPESCTRDRKEKFAMEFNDHMYTHKSLLELFNLQPSEEPEMARLSLMDPKSELEKKIHKEQTDEGAKGKDVLSEFSTKERRTYKGLLSPPQSPEKDEPESKERSLSDTIVLIRGLSEETTDRTLFDLFKKYGTLFNVRAPIDSHTDRSRGYGFVQFADPEDAAKALEGLGDKEVKMAWDDLAPKLTKSKILIKELPPSTTESELRHMCESYGTIEHVRKPAEKPYGFVEFSSHSEARKAVEKLQSKDMLAMIAKLDSERMSFGADGKDSEYGSTKPQENLLSDTIILIQSLPHDTTERTLFDLFKEFGTILYVRVPTVHGTSVIVGNGFVHFAEPEGAKKALEGLSGREEVKMAWKKNAPDLAQSQIVIQELLPSTSGFELQQMCQGYGTIVNFYKPQSRNIGFVEFTNRNEAVKALVDLQSRDVLAMMARPRRPR